MYGTGFVFSSKSLLSFRSEMSQPRLSMATRGSAWQPGIADEVVTTGRSHDLKFDKGTIYIVYFHTNVHVHIGKMGNLSKSKIKLYICDNKLRSCAQSAPRGKSAPGC